MNARRQGAVTYENFTVTVENGKRVFIDGCRSIMKYETDCVRIRLYKRSVSVLGEGLKLTSFSQRELCISGRISSVVLEESV